MREVILATKTAGPADTEALLAQLQPLTPAKVAQLRVALSDPDAFVRKTAIELLSRHGDTPLKGLAHCLGDKEKEVREAAEKALVAAGPVAVPILVELLSQEPCTSRAKVAAARALGGIKSAVGIPALVESLRRCYNGGFELAAAFDALHSIGVPSLLPLVDLTRYRALKGGAYSTLLKYEPGILAASMQVALGDSGIDARLRLQYAEQANIILGTARVRDTLVAFMESLEKDTTVPRDIVREARRFIDELRSGHSVRAPLTLQKIETEYGEQALMKAYADESRAEEEKKRWELIIRNAASAKSGTESSTLVPNQTEDKQGSYSSASDRRDKMDRELQCKRWYKNHSVECEYLRQADRQKGSGMSSKGTQDFCNQQCPY